MYGASKIKYDWIWRTFCIKNISHLGMWKQVVKEEEVESLCRRPCGFTRDTYYSSTKWCQHNTSFFTYNPLKDRSLIQVILQNNHIQQNAKSHCTWQIHPRLLNLGVNWIPSWQLTRWMNYTFDYTFDFWMHYKTM